MTREKKSLDRHDKLREIFPLVEISEEMASNIVVTDSASLAQNFSENAKGVLCSAAFGAGAYAIGGSLLGFPPLTPAAALVTGGSLLAALALCPSGADQSEIFGAPPAFSGGQCVGVQYGCRQSFLNTFNGSVLEGNETALVGPISAITPREGPGAFGPVWLFDIVSGPSQGLTTVDSQLTVASYEYLSSRVYRIDGLPDNCGNAPNTGGQIIQNIENGDTIDNSKVVNNSNYSTVIPVVFNLGGVNGTLNLKFGPITIGSLLPLSFNIDIGGSDYKFKQKPDGTLEPEETNPDKDSPNNKLEGLLKDIKSCVCTPAVDLDMLLLPAVFDEVGCGIETETFLVPKGSVSDGQFQRFVQSAVFAQEGCMRSSVEQKEQTLIFSASTTQDGREIFTGKIKPEIISLVLKITEIRPDGPAKIDLFPASNQRKFGSVSFVTDGVQGGGDYVYVFDTETYIPLPTRGKEGRLRILMKKGLSFEVYDSGERV